MPPVNETRTGLADFDRPRLRQVMIFFCIASLAFVVPAVGAIDPMTSPRYMGQAAVDTDQWQRITFRLERHPLRRAAQIRVAIQTRGPSMQGLIRIPGAPASNFDTGKGLTVVDLINVGDEMKGYAEIVALEILFTQTTLGQSYQVFAVDDGASTN